MRDDVKDFRSPKVNFYMGKIPNEVHLVSLIICIISIILLWIILFQFKYTYYMQVPVVLCDDNQIASFMNEDDKFSMGLTETELYALFYSGSMDVTPITSRHDIDIILENKTAINLDCYEIERIKDDNTYLIKFDVDVLPKNMVNRYPIKGFLRIKCCKQYNIINIKM